MLSLARKRGRETAHKSTCQHCEFFDGDTDLTWIHIGTRSHQVYLHRCRVNPERTDLVQTRVIGGVKYLLICADDGVEVNGIQVDLEE